MAYMPIGWVDGSTPRLNAANLNHMDQGIQAAVRADTVTTKGDLIVATGNAAVARVGVGADGQALVADSTQASGVSWRDSRWIDVRSYGAKGDGTTDDTAAINAALATSRNVFLPAGTYRIVAPSSGFTLLNNQQSRSIRGAGMGATTIALDGGGSGLAFDATGATLSDLTIDGGFNPSTDTADLSSCVQANTGSTVRNVHILNTKGSCLVGVGTDMVFENNHLEKFGDHAIYCSGNVSSTSPYTVQTSSSRVVIFGNIIDDAPSYHNGSGGTTRGAIKLRNDVTDVVVQGNTVAADECVLIAGDTRATFACPARIAVIGNNLLTTYAGVRVETTIDSGAGDTGIRVSDGISITGNTIYCTNSSSNGVQLSLAQAAITGNTINAPSTYGISSVSSGDVGPSTIIGNRFTGAGGVEKPGTGTLISGNDFQGLTAPGVYLSYPCLVIGNRFASCATGVLNRTPSSLTLWSVIDDNMFDSCTTGLDHNDYTRSSVISRNKFQNCTTSWAVTSGTQTNGMIVDDNTFISGAALPTAGSSDAVTLVPTVPVVNVPSLPTAAVGFRGRIVSVNGATGVADGLYICQKNASDAYVWTLLT